jgi:hypothetical protein
MHKLNLNMENQTNAGSGCLKAELQLDIYMSSRLQLDNSCLKPNGKDDLSR